MIKRSQNTNKLCVTDLKNKPPWSVLEEEGGALEVMLMLLIRAVAGMEDREGYMLTEKIFVRGTRARSH